MTSALKDTMYGCIVGGAIGDSLGAAVEGSSYYRIRREYGRVSDFKPYNLPYSAGKPGMVTDDTVIRSHLCHAIIEHQGRITPDEYATVLRDYLDPENVWVPEEIVHKKLLLGMNPWYTGRELIPSSIMASAIQPVGAINAGNPRQAYQDAMNVAAVHQDRVHRESAATVAAGIARAFEPESTIEDVLETMQSVAHDILNRGFDLTLALADKADTIDAFAEAYYDELLDWTWPAERWSLDKFEEGLLFSDNTLESVPIAVGLLQFCGNDVEQAIIEGASFGRNCDAIASITGSIAGTVSGAENIPESWITQCEDANTALFERFGYDSTEGFKDMSQQLVHALEYEHQTARERSRFLESLVDGDAT